MKNFKVHFCMQSVQKRLEILSTLVYFIYILHLSYTDLKTISLAVFFIMI